MKHKADQRCLHIYPRQECLIGQSHDVKLCQLGEELMWEFLPNPILRDNGGDLRFEQEASSRQ